jgi:hypothetical protein
VKKDTKKELSKLLDEIDSIGKKKLYDEETSKSENS